MSFVEGFEFDRMAQRPMYANCPRWLIDRCHVNESSSVIDLGCGSGLVTQLLLDRFHGSPDFHVIALDPSEFELRLAKTRITDPRVTFLQGRAQDVVGLIPRVVDAVVICNVLHQIPRDERQPVLDAAKALVKPGGWVGANTLFYDGGVPPETREFYIVWMTAARRALAKSSLSAYMPSSTPAHQRLSPAQHAAMFAEAGYDQIAVEEVYFDWSVEDWEALCTYSVFIQGALSDDVDLVQGSAALIAGVRTAYQTLGTSTIKRGWLHCVAQKPE